MSIGNVGMFMHAALIEMIGSDGRPNESVHNRRTKLVAINHTLLDVRVAYVRP